MTGRVFTVESWREHPRLAESSSLLPRIGSLPPIHQSLQFILGSVPSDRLHFRGSHH